MQHHQQQPGWYISRKGNRHGPYTWDQVLAHAQQGLISPGDQLADPTSGQWTKASKLPGLLGPNGKPLRSRAWLGWSAGTLALAAVVAGVVLLGPFDLSLPGSDPDLGTYTYTPPTTPPIQTAQYGTTLPDRVTVLMADDTTRADAETVAAALSATIVGEMEIIGLYTLQTEGTTEAELIAALDAAAAQPGVDGAFPEQRSTIAQTRQGGRCEEGSELDDPAYAGGNGTSYQMVGVRGAWDLIRAHGGSLGDVQVGIVDDGLYQTGEFDGAVQFINASNQSNLSQPLTSNGAQVPYYSHGTAVATVIAADGDDGGVVGMASVLGSSLTVRSTDFNGSAYQTDTEAGAGDEAVITYEEDGTTWVNADLKMLMDQVKNGSTIINCSWGHDLDDGAPDPDTVEAFRRFFEWMGQNKPKVLFVCAAGNDGQAIGADGMWPAGIKADNVITVGNVDGNGQIGNTNTNTQTNDSEVTLAAPGDGVPHGVDANGNTVATDGGTSMAAPMVASVAALVRAVDDSLSGAQIKQLIADSAHTSWQGQAIESGVGGRVLSADKAVLAAINGKRQRAGESALTMTEALGGTGLELSASYTAPASSDPGDKGTWTITAALPQGAAGPVSIEGRYVGPDTVAGALAVDLVTGSSAQWTVAGDGAGTFHVKRTDTGACWRVGLGTGDAPAIATTPQGDPPPPPTGDDEIMAALRAALADVGGSLRENVRDPYSPEWTTARHYETGIDLGGPGGGFDLRHYDTPANARTHIDWAHDGSNAPFAFHDLFAFQEVATDRSPPGYWLQWAQGRYAFRVYHQGDDPAILERFAEALWWHFGGGTGPGTPTGPAKGIEYLDAPPDPDDLPFGTKADIGTVTE